MRTTEIMRRIMKNTSQLFGNPKGKGTAESFILPASLLARIDRLNNTKDKMYLLGLDIDVVINGGNYGR